MCGVHHRQCDDDDDGAPVSVSTAHMPRPRRTPQRTVTSNQKHDRRRRRRRYPTTTTTTTTTTTIANSSNVIPEHTNQKGNGPAGSGAALTSVSAMPEVFTTLEPAAARVVVIFLDRELGRRGNRGPWGAMVLPAPLNNRHSKPKTRHTHTLYRLHPPCGWFTCSYK